MRTDAAVAAVAGLNQARVQQYEEYFSTLFPKTVEDVFRRWLFAYASVHTSWKRNIILYEYLKDLDWIGNRVLLQQRVEASRAGCHNKRAEYITRFSEFFWQHPSWFNKGSHEGWYEYRDRIMEQAPGIGPAKSAFLVELVYFNYAQVACFDTHMVQLYGYTPHEYSTKGVRDKDLAQMERHWVETCQQHGVSPVTARWVCWDTKQKQPDSRYWSCVLEETWEQSVRRKAEPNTILQSGGISPFGIQSLQRSFTGIQAPLLICS